MKRLRAWLIGGGVLLGLFVVLVVVTSFLPEPSENVTGSITNPAPEGSRALAQVLEQQGVQVSQVTKLSDASGAPAGSTLVVFVTRSLSSAAITRLSQTPADLVVLNDRYSNQDLYDLTDGLVDSGFWGSNNADSPHADCDDPDALAAGTLSLPGGGTGIQSPGDEANLCFTDGSGNGLYAVGQTAHHRVTVIAGGSQFFNGFIVNDGNAALALRALGRYPQLTWYLPGQDAWPSSSDTSSGELSLWSLLPDWARAAAAVVVVAGAAAALWRGRRFGPLIREPLPVEVPAAEAATGLGRLYQQANARGHAAAGLRAATIYRLAPRLGLPPTAPPPLVVERLAGTTNRDPSYLTSLLYGPAPATDPDLQALAAALADMVGTRENDGSNAGHGRGSPDPPDATIQQTRPEEPSPWLAPPPTISENHD